MPALIQARYMYIIECIRSVYFFSYTCGGVPYHWSSVVDTGSMVTT